MARRDTRGPRDRRGHRPRAEPARRHRLAAGARRPVAGAGLRRVRDPHRRRADRRGRHARPPRVGCGPRGGVAGGLGGRGVDRGPGPPQRRDRRRQPVRRHALRLLQPERVVAEVERLLPQASRRHLPRRADRHALPCRVPGGPRARADRVRRVGRARGPARHADDRARGPLPRRRAGPSGAGAGRTGGGGGRPRAAPRRHRAPTARRARAARSISRSRAWPSVSPSTTDASPRSTWR